MLGSPPRMTRDWKFRSRDFSRSMKLPNKTLALDAISTINLGLRDFSAGALNRTID
jgi:hypothetical protein